LANSASLTTQIANQYANSLFDLARDSNTLDQTGNALARFDELIRGSDDLARMLHSPVFSADERIDALNTILDKAKIGGLVANFIRVVARNRRLFAMKDMLGAFRTLLAEYRGETTADVTIARKLSAAQRRELQAALKTKIGKDVTINEIVNPAILGGMIVKVGSRQIDTSLRTKLSSLKLALKEVD
jgi:F-type H+-transporting ATPase subunit delta